MTPDELVEAAEAILAPEPLHLSTANNLRFLSGHDRLPHNGEWYGPSGRTLAGSIWAALTGNKHPEAEVYDAGISADRVLEDLVDASPTLKTPLKGHVRRLRRQARKLGLIGAVDALADIAEDEDDPNE